jgi:hypothetical protein
MPTTSLAGTFLSSFARIFFETESIVSLRAACSQENHPDTDSLAMRDAYEIQLHPKDLHPEQHRHWEVF